MSVETQAPDRFVELLRRLSDKAVEDYYNPFVHFQWPDTLPEDALWMTPSLMSTHGTAVDRELTDEQRRLLSKWESINFYSMNVHGIRELLTEVIARIHTRGFEIPSEFFHHFIGEENEHMWFFAEFCRRYGGKLYSSLNVKGPEETDPQTASLLVFSRILMFEEIVDHYNLVMADDPALHETIREVNRIHHKDESRHIAFGRELVAQLWNDVSGRIEPEQVAEIGEYLKRYMATVLDSFCNPRVYRDAGFTDTVALRSRILADPARIEARQRFARKPIAFFTKIGILTDPTLPLTV